MPLRRTSMPVVVVAIAVLAFAAGCSSADDTAACNTILNTVRDASSEASAQVSDPDAVGQTYIDAAADVRAAAKDVSDDVEKASENLATQLENLGTSLVEIDSTNPQTPDISGITEAGDQMQDACN